MLVLKMLQNMNFNGCTIDLQSVDLSQILSIWPVTRIGPFDLFGSIFRITDRISSLFINTLSNLLLIM